MSQPSHPWTAGASHLYTREFFELAREHLTPAGVFVQWMGPRIVDEELVRTLVGTLLSAFSHVRLYLLGGGLAFERPALISLLFFGNALQPRTIVGGIAVVACGCYIVYRENRPATSPTSPRKASP